MKRCFAYLSIIAFITFFSCGEGEKNSDSAEVQKENAFQQLDSTYNTYQVIMAGYDTGQFSQYYEKRIKPPIINLNQSLEDKTISDLYLLKNTILAMKGQTFDEAILHSYFRKIPWYQPPVWDENFLIQLTDAEHTFINRINQRIVQLSKENTLQDGEINSKNALNLFQYADLTSDDFAKINTNGFLLTGYSANQPANLYIENHKKGIPSFITTDLMLHQMHLFYGLLENEIEAVYLTDILKSMLEIINIELYSSYEKTLDSLIEITIEESLLYYSIPYGIITGNKTNLIGNYNRIYYKELGKVLEGKGIGSSVINDDKFNYRIFKPHGHYTKNKKIRNYYKAITWLQKISLCLNNEDEFSRAILIAHIINQSADLRNKFAEYMEIKTYFSSQRKQFTFWDLANLLNQVEGIKTFEDIFQPQTLQKVRDLLYLKDSESCQIRVSLMPVEYQNLYTDLSQIIKDNANPSPLQMFAALGNNTAHNLLKNPTNPESILENILKISTQEEARSMDWLSTLLTSLDDDNGIPEYMQKPQWRMKNLNAALSSWTQLNQRVNVQTRKILKTKKDVEMDLHLQGFVEPNIAFWESASTLLENTRVFLTDRYLLSKNTNENIDNLLSVITFLKSVSQKELLERKLTNEEFKRIASIGVEIQNITFHMLKNSFNSVDHEISSNMAYVANIFRDERNIFAGIGPAHTILFPIQIDDHIYLTSGSVYSYYELPDYPKTSISGRDWENMLNNAPSNELIPWMKDYYENDQTLIEPIIARN